MNWISEVVRPRIKTLFKRESPENLWIKCPDSGQMVFHKDVEANAYVIPGSEHHMRVTAPERLRLTFDDGKWLDVALPEVAADPLKFRDEKRYVDRLKDARAKTGMQDAFKIGYGRVKGLPMTLAVQDFHFMGGSLGMAAGEAFVKGAETALDKKTPYVVFAASGGARMQEGILSLMQMAKASAVLSQLAERRIPYISVLTNPTTGGVSASFAMLGDAILAEPGAVIGFAGPRVIKQTLGQDLPEGFQTAEFLLEKGMVDRVVHRKELRSTLSRLLRHMTGRPAAAAHAEQDS